MGISNLVTLLVVLRNGTCYQMSGMPRSYGLVLKNDLDHWLLGSRTFECLGEDGEFHSVPAYKIARIDLVPDETTNELSDENPFFER